MQGSLTMLKGVKRANVCLKIQLKSKLRIIFNGHTKSPVNTPFRLSSNRIRLEKGNIHKAVCGFICIDFLP